MFGARVLADYKTITGVGVYSVMDRPGFWLDAAIVGLVALIWIVVLAVVIRALHATWEQPFRR